MAKSKVAQAVPPADPDSFSTSDGLKTPPEEPLAGTPEAYRAHRLRNWDSIAQNLPRWDAGNRYYHRRLTQVFENLVPPGQRVIEIGCAQGDLLAALKPSYGVGVDFSAEMVARAMQKHPELTFVHADAHELTLDETFDVVILSDLVNDVWDVEMVFQRIRPLCTHSTRVIVNCYSRVWAPVLGLTAKLGLSTPKLAQNWLVPEDVSNLLYLAGFETLRNQPEILWPLPFRPLSALLNRWLVKLWPFWYFALTNITIARPFPNPAGKDAPRVSVVVPARNEAGNIAEIIRRTPEMGAGTELIFVEGHSTDDTWETIQREVARSGRPCKIFQQTGKGKGDAVRLGFAQASTPISPSHPRTYPSSTRRWYPAGVTSSTEYGWSIPCTRKPCGCSTSSAISSLAWLSVGYCGSL